MTLLDYAVLAILALSIIISVWRGLVREMLSLLAWVVAFIVASLFAGDFSKLLPAVLGLPALRMIVSFVVLLIGTSLVMSLVNWGILRGLNAAGVALADRGLGGLFGLARGCIIVVALAMVAGMTRIPEFPEWKNALFRPLIEAAVETVQPFLPDDIAARVKF